MKKTLSNLRKVYKYGKKYRKSLFITMFCCVLFITFNIVVPIFTSKQLLYLTDSLFEELFYASVVVFIIMFVNSFV